MQLCSNELKNKLLVLKNKYGYMAWLRAAENSSLEALDLTDLCSGSRKIPEDLLLAQGEEGETALLMAAQGKTM